jgi:glyoxylase-like metal-dependent hydrolase (beta-lactamase superfamily II)
MSKVSGMLPRGPINVSRVLEALPEDGSIPHLPGWRWIHVPGHSPGQIALWRESDRTLLSADAVITTAQESAYAVAVQKPELHGPPQYWTIHWGEAATSARRLAELEPELLLSGHGDPLQGPAMRAALHTLADEFERVAVPHGSLYDRHPLSANDGSAYVPVERRR